MLVIISSDYHAPTSVERKRGVATSEPGPSGCASKSKRTKTDGEDVIFAMSSNHYN